MNEAVRKDDRGPARRVAGGPEVRLVELTKRFGELVAVDHVSLDIPAGEFFSLLGPSCTSRTPATGCDGWSSPP
jgi:ABC-type glutathione transport system ATPase component